MLKGAIYEAVAAVLIPPTQATPTQQLHGVAATAVMPCQADKQPSHHCRLHCITYPLVLLCRDSRSGATTGTTASRRTSSNSAVAESPAGQVGAIAGCLTSSLQRFAFGESLSTESRGGGLQSNARLLPYLFQLGLCFVGFCDETDLQVCTALCQTNNAIGLYVMKLLIVLCGFCNESKFGGMP